MVLAWHVDYWDYLGWKDTFASKAYTARQKRYKAARGLKRHGTPHIYVNNESWWGKRGARDGIDNAKRGPAPIEIRAKATTEGRKVSVAIRVDQASKDFTPTKATAVLAILHGVLT